MIKKLKEQADLLNSNVTTTKPILSKTSHFTFIQPTDTFYQANADLKPKDSSQIHQPSHLDLVSAANADIQSYIDSQL